MDTLLNVVLWILVGILVYRLFRWITTPLFRKLGVYLYYSPIMFTVPFGLRTLELHVGTTWDFFRQTNLTEQQMILHLAKGLLGLIEAANNGLVPQTMKLRGTVYYFRAETLKRFGFTSRKMNPVETFVFLLNWLELVLLHSIIKRRLTFVQLSSVRVVHATITDVIHHKAEIERLVDSLVRKTQRTSLRELR